MRGTRLIGMLLGILCIVVLSISSPRLASAYHTMWGANSQRTHQSSQVGPSSAAPNQISSVTAGCDVSVNSTATIDAEGNVFFGTWGRIIRDPDGDKTKYRKYDGKVYGLSWDLGQELWPPIDPQLVPLCYEYDGRAHGGGYCASGQQLNGYNGTIEGVGAIGPDGLIYYGRGDGFLYAIDPEIGEVAWSFRTYNPMDGHDPEGGGEIVTPPLIHDGIIYFATWAPSQIANAKWETNAIYGVDLASRGELHWRYPSDEASLEHEEFLAAPVLSPDGATVYFGTFRDHLDGLRTPRKLYAFRTDAGFEVDDANRLKFVRETNDPAVPNSTITITRMLADQRGNLYIGGVRSQRRGAQAYENHRAIVLKLDANGNPVWDKAFEVGIALDGVHVLGLSLWEDADEPRTLYVGQGNNNFMGGALIALDAITGETQWTWRAGPNDANGQVNDPAIDADGNIYFGVRGGVGPMIKGARVVSLTPDGHERWRYALNTAIDWSAPVLGHRGTLYFGDRAVESFPFGIFDANSCDPRHIPRMYAIRPDIAPVYPENAGGCGCDSISSGAAPIKFFVLPLVTWLGLVLLRRENKAQALP